MTDSISSIVAIDIGTSKVSVLVGRVHSSERIEVTGIAYAPNRGMQRGIIQNMDKVIAAIKEAVAQAEEMADCRIHTAWVGIPSPELKSFNAMGQTAVLEQVVNTTELVRTLEMAKSQYSLPDHYLINNVLQGIAINGQGDWVEHPVGISASSITGHYHLMFLPIDTMQTLERAMKGAGIGIERMIIASLATAERALLPEEREQGICLVDIGAGTTNINVYGENRLVLSHTLSVGGDQVTRDIAAVLKTSYDQAEIFKLKYGSVDRASIKPEQLIRIASTGHMPDLTLSRLELADIIIARYEEILQQVYTVLEESGAIGLLQRGYVLSGEACQIEGMTSLARHFLGLPVHMASTQSVLTTSDPVRRDMLSQPGYDTAAGLLLYSQSEQRLSESGQVIHAEGPPLRVLRPFQWLIERLKQLV